jgi:hypothetical protein
MGLPPVAGHKLSREKNIRLKKQLGVMRGREAMRAGIAPEDRNRESAIIAGEAIGLGGGKHNCIESNSAYAKQHLLND